MSHGAKPAVAALFGLAFLLSAGVAAAACSGHPSQSVQAPAPETVVEGDKVVKPTRG